MSRRFRLDGEEFTGREARRSVEALREKYTEADMLEATREFDASVRRGGELMSQLLTVSSPAQVPGILAELNNCLQVIHINQYFLHRPEPGALDC